VRNATKFSVDAESLSNELQQLGLPKEHATALCKAYEDNADDLRKEFLLKTLRLSRLEAVDWRVDYILGSSQLKDICEPSVQLRLRVSSPESNKVESLAFTLSSEKFRVLLDEMKQAYEIMENLSTWTLYSDIIYKLIKDSII